MSDGVENLKPCNTEELFMRHTATSCKSSAVSAGNTKFVSRDRHARAQAALHPAIQAAPVRSGVPKKSGKIPPHR